MDTFTAGEDLSLTVVFMDDGEPFVPDPTGLGWFLRDHTGAKGDTTALEAVTTSSINVLITADHNVIPSGMRFAKSFLCVYGTNAGVAFTTVTPYTITPWINTTVVPDDIRSYFGVDVGELGDDDINIPNAYFDLVDSIGDESILRAALASGTALETQANTAILMKASMDVIPGMQLRLSQAESDGSLSMSRMPNIDIDFAALYKLAGLIYADAVTAISGRIPAQWTGFVVSKPVDIITYGRHAVFRIG